MLCPVFGHDYIYIYTYITWQENSTRSSNPLMLPCPWHQVRVTETGSVQIWTRVIAGRFMETTGRMALSNCVFFSWAASPNSSCTRTHICSWDLKKNLTRAKKGMGVILYTSGVRLAKVTELVNPISYSTQIRWDRLLCVCVWKRQTGMCWKYSCMKSYSRLDSPTVTCLVKTIEINGTRHFQVQISVKI